MSVTNELHKLEELRVSGTLTEEEFARDMLALLAGGTPLSVAAEAHYQSELARIDREWEQEKERYLIPTWGGNRCVPTRWRDMFGLAIFFVALGVIWMSVWAILPAIFNPPGGSMLNLFLVCGIIKFGTGIYLASRNHSKAEAHNLAHAAYQQRRAAVKPEDFR